MAPLSARIGVVISDLATKACVPCRGGVPPLKRQELAALEKQVDGWNVIEEHHLAKIFTFPDRFLFPLLAMNWRCPTLANRKSLASPSKIVARYRWLRDLTCEAPEAIAAERS
jgi:hypothetical protein